MALDHVWSLPCCQGVSEFLDFDDIRLVSTVIAEPDDAAGVQNEVAQMQDRTMVTFTSGQTRFTYRVGAIIIRADHVLLMRNLTEVYWFVPGGRAEIGESAAKALAREISEELGGTARVERLIWINENFFRLGSTLHHELALYFSVAIPADTLADLSATYHCDEADGTRFEVVWHRRDALKEVQLVPSFLIEALTNIPSAVQHVIQVDDSARTDWDPD